MRSLTTTPPHVSPPSTPPPERAPNRPPPSAPPEPPSSPRGPIQVRDITSDSAMLRWQPPEYTGGAPITGYVIEMRESTRLQWRRIGMVEPTTTAFTLADMSEDVEYFVRVTARNRAGDSFPLISDVIAPLKSHSESSPTLATLKG